jgi:hypothetical protein
VYKILDYYNYNRQRNTLLMYNLFMFYQYSYAACFNDNFGHHQALNEHSQVITHIEYNMEPYLLTDYWATNMSRGYVTKLQIW